MTPQAETVRDLLATAERMLAGVEGARLDAECLLRRVIDVERSWLYAHPGAAVDPSLACDFRLLVRRRGEGCPVAYLTGEKEFWSMPFLVNRHTLIPRPETELLVESALELHRDSRSLDMLDLGTGCGAIAVALASERPDCRITASDISREALGVAQMNAQRLGCPDIEFLLADWFSGFGSRRFDVILCNPPYVDSADAALHAPGVRFEPRLALDGGHGGIQAINLIVAGAARHLPAEGLLLLEHGSDQGEHVRRLLAMGGFRNVRTLKDCAGLERISIAQCP